MPQTLLMIEDDSRLADMVVDYLTHEGFDVAHAARAAEGLEWLRSRRADLVILDLMLPDASGLDVCRTIRADSDLPILMLTAKGDPTDRVVGLELGADDYLPKPFEPRELLARVRAILRRSGTGRSASGMLRFGRLAIDRDARSVRVDDRHCELTAHQFDLLVVLAQRAGRVISREQLMDLTQGGAMDPFDRSIDVHVARIRAAIEDDPKAPRRLLTVRGSGYVFSRVQDG